MYKRIAAAVCALIPWVVAVCALLAMLSERWLVGCLVSATGALLLGLLLRGRGLRAAPLHLPLLILALLCGLSMRFVTPLAGFSAVPAARLLMGVLLCLAWSDLVSSARGLGWLAAAFALAVFGLGLGAPFFIAWVDKFTFWPALSKILPQVTAEAGAAFNPNVAGGTFAALLAGAAGALIFAAPALSIPRRLALLLLIALLGLDLALTQTRAALLAAAAALALLAALRWKWGWVPGVIGAAAAGGLVLSLGPDVVWQSLMGATGGYGTLTMREEIWLRARLVIAEFPLTGIGMGTFPAVIARIYPMGAFPDHAHNLFLQLAADLGIPGLAAWVGCFFTTLAMAWRLLRKRAAGALYPALGGAALGFNAVLALHGLLDCVLWGTRPAILVWIIWGLTAAAWSLSSPAGPSSPIDTDDIIPSI